MSRDIHDDAEAESARGSFGYSDRQLYRFMFGYLTPFKSEVIVILVLMLFFSITTALAPLMLFISIGKEKEEQER